MFQRHLSLSIIGLLSSIVSHVSAADELSRYTVSVGAAGCGTLSVTDAGTVRGVMRLGGKPVSFSAKIEGGHFAVSAKAARGAMFDADFTIVGEEIVAAGTLGDGSVGISVTPYSAGAFRFCGPGTTPVSVNIRKASLKTFLTGSLASNGKFTASERFSSPLNVKVNKTTGIATGKLGATAFIGIISDDVVSAICDDGSRITIRSFAPFIAPTAEMTTPGGISPAIPKPKPVKLVGNLLQNFTGSSSATTTASGSILSSGGNFAATLNLPLTLGAATNFTSISSGSALVKSGSGSLTIGSAQTSRTLSGGTLSLGGAVISNSSFILNVSSGTLAPGAVNVSAGSQLTIAASASIQTVENLLRSAFTTRPVDTTLLGDPANGTVAIEAALAAWRTLYPEFVFNVGPGVLSAAFYTATFNRPVPIL